MGTATTHTAPSPPWSLLEATPGADGVLDTIVVTVAESLRLPYAAIELRNGERPTLSPPRTAPRRRAASSIGSPLVYRGEPVGHLILAPRSPRREVQRCRRAPPRRSRPPGGARRGSGTPDLRPAPLASALVTAREEERRRPQRDLHDGIGPTLSGALMKMEVARSRLTERPGEADQMLSELAADTATRHRRGPLALTYDLRPPVLDQLGLAAALREQAAGSGGEPRAPAGGRDRDARRTSPAQRGRGGGGLSDWARGSDERGAP